MYIFVLTNLSSKAPRLSPAHLQAMATYDGLLLP